MTDKAEMRQQLIQLLEIANKVGPELFDMEALHREFMIIAGVTEYQRGGQFGPTERQRTLGRLLGRKPEDFIP